MTHYNVALWSKAFGDDFKTLVPYLESRVENPMLNKLGIHKVADVIDQVAEASLRFGRTTKNNLVLIGVCKECGFSREQLIKRLAGPQALMGKEVDDYKNNVAPAVSLDQLLKAIIILNEIQVPEAGKALKAGYVVILPKTKAQDVIELNSKGKKALFGRKITDNLYHYELKNKLKPVVEAAPSITERHVAKGRGNDKDFDPELIGAESHTKYALKKGAKGKKVRPPTVS